MKNTSLKRAFEPSQCFLASIGWLAAAARPGLALAAGFFAAPLAGFSGATTPGEVVAWGSSGWGTTNVPDFGPAVAVSAGRSYRLALRPNGTVVAWGRGTSGETNVPAGLWATSATAACSRPAPTR